MKASWAIGLIVGLSVLHYSVMGYAGHDPSIEARFVMTLALTLVIAWWAFDDAKKRKYHRPYEFGAFLFFAWPIVLPFYLVATRGWKGIFNFSVFVLLFCLPWLMGWGAYYMNPSNQ